MKISHPLAITLGALLSGGVAFGQVESARIHVDGMTWAGCAAGVQRQVEKIDGVERAEVDWKEKRAEVYATSEGFDPAELPKAVRAAGFTAPDANIGLEVTASGRVVAEGERRFFELAGWRWLLSGELAADPPAVATSELVRARGRLRIGEGVSTPTLEILEWDPPRSPWPEASSSR